MGGEGGRGRRPGKGKRGGGQDKELDPAPQWNCIRREGERGTETTGGGRGAAHLVGVGWMRWPVSVGRCRVGPLAPAFRSWARSREGENQQQHVQSRPACIFLPYSTVPVPHARHGPLLRAHDTSPRRCTYSATQVAK